MPSNAKVLSACYITHICSIMSCNCATHYSTGWVTSVLAQIMFPILTPYTSILYIYLCSLIPSLEAGLGTENETTMYIFAYHYIDLLPLSVS